jgi:hypothetical protein
LHDLALFRLCLAEENEAFRVRSCQVGLMADDPDFADDFNAAKRSKTKGKSTPMKPAGDAKEQGKTAKEDQAQSRLPLEGVNAYLDVRTDGAHVNDSFATQIEKLGGKVMIFHFLCRCGVRPASCDEQFGSAGFLWGFAGFSLAHSNRSQSPL